MSIRHYTPRRNRRHGISSRTALVLYSVLAVAILMQISYPLLSGEPLRFITVATVYWGAGAMALHALLSYGARYAFSYLGVTLVFALLVESLGVNTGWPFGVYEYSPSLGVSIMGVPIVVPFAWVMMVHPVLVAARYVTKGWVFLYGGAGLMAWDLFLDPQMVSAGRWTWEVTGSHIPFQPDVPFSNAFGWLLCGMAIVALLHQILPLERRKESASLTAVDVLLGWTLFSGIVGNIFFFDRQGVAFLGGIVYGLIFVPYFLIRWLGRP